MLRLRPTHAAVLQVVHNPGFHPLAPSAAAAAWLGFLLATAGLGLLYLTTISDPGNIARGASSAARGGSSRPSNARKSSPSSQHASGAIRHSQRNVSARRGAWAQCTWLQLSNWHLCAQGTV